MCVYVYVQSVNSAQKKREMITKEYYKNKYATHSWFTCYRENKNKEEEKNDEFNVKIACGLDRLG